MNRLLETTLGTGYYLRVRVYPFHVLRENPLASGAGADRMSKGMQKAFGKTIGAAARVMQGDSIIELRLNKEHLKTGKEALSRAAKKLPCSCSILTQAMK